MSKNARIALAAAGVVIIVVAIILIGSSESSDDSSPTPVQEAPTASTAATGGHDHADDEAADEHSGGSAPAEDNGGSAAAADVVSPVLKPGSPQTVKAKKGQTVELRARSDRDATLHVHGYDAMVDLKPNKTGKVTFKAKIDGEFSIEFHFTGDEAPAGTLQVSP